MMGADMFVTLSNLMKDEADCVRGYFVRRLNKGISRNRLTIEYLSFFSIVAVLEPTNMEEENAIKLYVFITFPKEYNRNQMLSVYLPYHQPEYAIAYAVWLLSHQEILSTHSDIPNMALLQECLWFIMEPFIVKKENTDFEFIYCLFQDIKESNDAMFDKRQKKGEIGEAELVGQSKVYAPHELIEDEKERNGKLPTRDRKRLNSTSSLVLSKRSTREAKNACVQ
ncbi:unnamed protein product [Strongylus vulgaris]|uniref:Uncharacterized protein n=1 Tax=Strongylus vulgaris TaxID=40348 RepID=A0A3P7LDH7_STRVU|nr:unnamed protein product [Strongylus vulgaris]